LPTSNSFSRGGRIYSSSNPLASAGEKAHDFTFSLYFDLKNNTNWVSRPGLGLDDFLACAKEALSQVEIESEDES
jgi:hypothetical protein